MLDAGCWLCGIEFSVRSVGIEHRESSIENRNSSRRDKIFPGRQYHEKLLPRASARGRTKKKQPRALAQPERIFRPYGTIRYLDTLKLEIYRP